METFAESSSLNRIELRDTHWKVQKQPSEAAVLRPNANREMTVVRAGISGAWLLPLIPGEPLLAWADGATTAQKTAELIRTLPHLDAASLAAATPAWYPHEP